MERGNRQLDVRIWKIGILFPSFLFLLSYSPFFYYWLFNVKRPEKTLQHSLFTTLENAQEHVANIYLEYPYAIIWAHEDKKNKKRAW